MFRDTRSGDDESTSLTTDVGAPGSLRNLGLKLNGGSWALPSIPADLLTSEIATVEHKLLAKFALGAEKLGLPLPAEPFTTIEKALSAQFTGYFERLGFPLQELCPLGIVFGVEREVIRMDGWAQQGLPIVKLKPVVTELMGKCPWLASFLVNTFASSHGIGLATYEPNRLDCLAEMIWFYCASSDEEMMLEVTRALLNARKRGVTVRLVVDHDQNLSAKNKNTKSVAALAALVNSGATVRSVSTYLLMHDKCAILDSSHVQTGSFNYTQAAATRNSENVLVNWHAPALAAAYGKHFEEVWSAGQPFNGR